MLILISNPNFSLTATIEYVVAHLIPDLLVLSKVDLSFHLMIMELVRLRLPVPIKKTNPIQGLKY